MVIKYSYDLHVFINISHQTFLGIIAIIIMHVMYISKPKLNDYILKST